MRIKIWLLNNILFLYIYNQLNIFRQEQRPSTSSTASDSAPAQYLTFPQPIVTTSTSSTSESGTQALPPPTIITSSVTPPATSPTVPTTTATTPTHPLLATRRDSTTQCGRLGTVEYQNL